jgi:two-component system, cell cycle sensor histidine kinase and response regulator CckA
MMDILNSEPAVDRPFIPCMAARRRALPAGKIRVLMLEDSASDAELTLRQLRRSGFDPDWQRVETREQFVAHLDPKIDIILAEYNVPHFGGLTALRCLRQSGLDIPFILLSGLLADEMAAQCIRQGAIDYLLKDRLQRLGLAVSNALAEKLLRVERKLVDEKLRQAQRMEAIGQLTGGIAHDFNNVLTVINGYTSLLLDGESLPPGALKALKQVQLAGERGVGLTQQLLFFSRKRPNRRQSIDLNEIVNGIATLLRRLIGEPISLELNLSPELRVIEADVSMMEQILMNLVVNARDAMTTGHVVVDTRMAFLTEANVRGRANARAGSFVSLSVCDEGRGIPPEVLSRIFEPFFTTKDVGKGTGLGLATVFGVVQEHRGWVEVDSTIGSGTTFKIFLPVACADAQPLLE